MKAIAEELVAQAIPLTGGRGEKLLRFRPPLRDRRLQAALILRRRRRRADLLAYEQPEPPGRRVKTVAAHRVETARPFGARTDPASVGQRLQVAADRRLRQLHDPAQLGDRQLVAIEQQENAAPRRVRKRRKSDREWQGRGRSSV